MKKLKLHGAIQMRGGSRNLLGREVKYKLYAIRRPCTCYAIEVVSGNERCVRCFGKDKHAVLDIYKKIVACSVTPCTLDDIADDFAVENKLIG